MLYFKGILLDKIQLNFQFLLKLALVCFDDDDVLQWWQYLNLHFDGCHSGYHHCGFLLSFELDWICSHWLQALRLFAIGPSSLEKKMLILDKTSPKWSNSKRITWVVATISSSLRLDSLRLLVLTSFFLWGFFSFRFFSRGTSLLGEDRFPQSSVTKSEEKYGEITMLASLESLILFFLS